jgi:hypothetical protein
VELVKEHGLDIEGKVKIIEELKPYFDSLSKPEQTESIGKIESCLKMVKGSISLSLNYSGKYSLLNLDPKKTLLIDQEKNFLKFILNYPNLFSEEEINNWAEEFEDRALKRLMHLVISSFREHGALDHSLLLERVEEEHLKKQICALTLEEGEYNGSPGELLADDWRRAWLRRRLKKARARIKRELEKAAADPGGEELLALLAQRQEIDRQLDDLK